MPYNLSKRAVLRQIRYLTDMANAQRTLTWPAKDPKKLAGYIRESMAAADANKEDFPHLVGLHDKYRLKALKTGVCAVWLGDEVREDHIPAPIPQEGEAPEGYAPPSLVPPVEPTPLEKMTADNLVTLNAIVGAAVKHNHASEIFFPAAALNDEELVKLWQWARTKGWQVIDHGMGEGVTLTRLDVPEDIVFNPEED